MNNAKEKELPTPEEKLLHPSTFWEKYSKCRKQVALLLLLLFVIGGAFVATNNREQIAIPARQPTATLFSMPTTDPTITAEWESYMNTKYGYTLKYPSNLFRNCSLDYELFALRDGTETCSADDFLVGFAVAVNKRIQKSETIVEDYEKSVDETCYLVTKQEIIITGLRATKYYNTLHETDSPGCKRIEVVYKLDRDEVHIRFEKESYTYLLSFYKNYGDEIENQIFSTFKFID